MSPQHSATPTKRHFHSDRYVAVVCTILLMIPNSSVALSGAIALVAVGRQFAYSTFFAQLQRTAGPNYGKLAGAANLCVALAGMLQPVLVALSSTDAEEESAARSFGTANAILLVLVLALFSQPLPCWQDGTSRVAGGGGSGIRSGKASRTTSLEAGGLATLRVALLPNDGRASSIDSIAS